MKQTWILLVFLSLMLGSAGAQDVTVDIRLNQDTIGIDQHALLQITVSGSSQDLPDPVMPSLPMFEVYSQGRSSNLSVINGKVSSAVTYRYMLLPQKPGTFPIDNIAVVHNNKRIQGNTLTLTVLDQGTATPNQLEDQAAEQSNQARDYFMEAVVDNKNPFVNEQVTLTLKFYTAVRYYGSPELTEPTTTGFWTEILGNKAPYYQNINNRTYKVIERSYALFPTQTGELTIGRASIKFTVRQQNTRTRDPFDMFSDVFGRGQEVAVQSPYLNVNVRPLPDKGRPADFSGTIGKFKISVVADKQEVEVNQPVTVTIKITGTGNIKSVAEPPIPELEDFRVYQSSSSENVSKLNDKLGGTKIFEEVFIPRRPGTLEIPALTFNYFDPDAGAYRSTTTKPISLKAIRPEGYTESPDIPFTAPDLMIGSSARDIRFIKTDPGNLRQKGRLILFSPLYLAINGIPVLALIATVLVRRRREKLSSNVGYARSRRAGKMARRRLARARSLASTQQPGMFFAEISQAVAAYVADLFNISPHGLTIDRITSLLESQGAGSELLLLVSDLLKKCDFARFAPASLSQSDIDAALQSAEQAMVQMEGLRRG
jgi:hypothetical protein